jgi:SAM-dependent methyltransferase
MPESIEERDRREREAYADDAMTRNNAEWQIRVSHIVLGPTTQRGWDTMFSVIVAGMGDERRVLDVGCGPGYYTNIVKQLGARTCWVTTSPSIYVYKAQRDYGVPGELDFRVHSAHQPLEGDFDVVCGFAVLHHLDFRAFLLEGYNRNLKPGGRMVFREPMSHPVTLAFHKFVRSAHSEDE